MKWSLLALYPVKFFPSLIPGLQLSDIWPFVLTSTAKPRYSLKNSFQDSPYIATANGFGLHPSAVPWGMGT